MSSHQHLSAGKLVCRSPNINTQSHCAAAAYDYSLANPIFHDLNVHLIQTPSTKLFILEECLVVYGYFDKKRNGNFNTISHPKHIFHAFFGGFPASLGLSLVRTDDSPVKLGLARVYCTDKMFA